MDNLKERFACFDKPNYFSRVDADHILELHIGIDEKSRKAIELRSTSSPRKITGTSAIEVNQYRKDAYNTIRFALIEEDVSGLFFTFCEDLIEQTRNLRDKNEGYRAIVNRFFQWKKLFVAPKRNYLSEPEIMGLIGEILFLKGDLSERIGLSAALKSWSGQELTHKDFSNKEDWFEVKTINRSSRAVRISSLEQLDSDIEGELIVFSLEKMSVAYNGITLNKLIIETQALFETFEEREDFLTKVALQGYEICDYYDDFVYELGGLSKYIINNEFPRLTKRSLPTAVRSAIYDISLADIADFRIEK